MKPYSVLIVESAGFCEDPRGDFDGYDEAYEVFAKSVQFIDELSFKTDDYVLGLDTVQLLKDDTVIMVWQRPPWRTDELHRAWARTQGLSGDLSTTRRFIGLSVADDGQTIRLNRRV